MSSPLRARRAGLVMLLLCLHITALAQGQAAWLWHYETAKVRAAAENKELLIYFTGSDWCPNSRRLDAEILDQEAFQTLVQRFFVLVKLDYPQYKEQKAEIRAQNAELQREFFSKFRLSGYPTIYLADARGEPYARVGYRQEDPTAYLGHLLYLTRARPMVNPGLTWLEDLAEAQLKAEYWDRDLLLYFAGSDWCRWCRELEGQLLSHELFLMHIPPEFVLVKLDYPRSGEQSDWLMKQNELLKHEYTEQYQLEGYPTLYLVTADGQPYAKTVYTRVSAQTYVDRLLDLKEKHRERLRGQLLNQ